MEPTPVSLLERLRQPDDQEAWCRFVDLYSPLIYYWARRAGASPEDASDLVQDVFVVLVEKLPEFQYDKSKSFRSWLRTVTLNKWRARARRPSLPMAAVDVAEVADPAVPEGFSETEYRQELARQALKTLRPTFPEKTRRNASYLA